MWDEINYPAPMFNSATIDVWDWISYFMTHFIGCMITSFLTPVAHDTRIIKCVPWHSPESNFTHVTDQVHKHFLWNYFQVNATESLWWYINSGSANELLSSGSNLLSDYLRHGCPISLSQQWQDCACRANKTSTICIECFTGLLWYT